MATITTTHSMRGGGAGPTVGEIKQFIAGLGDTAQVSLTVTRGDQHDPSEWTMTSSEVPRSPGMPTYAPSVRRLNTFDPDGHP